MGKWAHFFLIVMLLTDRLWKTKRMDCLEVCQRSGMSIYICSFWYWNFTVFFLSVKLKMDILVITVHKYNFEDDFCLGGNTYELRRWSHSYFSAACESAGTARRLQRWRVVKSGMTEESGLNTCTKHEEENLVRICAEQTSFKSRKHQGRGKRAGRPGYKQ